MSDRQFKWYWGYGEEPDVFYGGEDSRDAILQVARRECDGEGFSIVEADKSVPDFGFFDADQVLEQYDEHNIECWSEDGPDFPDIKLEVKRELEKALGATLKRWMDKHKCHGRAWAFGSQRHQEYFPAVSGPTP